MTENGERSKGSSPTPDDLDRLIDGAFERMHHEHVVDLRRRVLSRLDESVAGRKVFGAAVASRVTLLAAAGLIAAVALTVTWRPWDRLIDRAQQAQAIESGVHHSVPASVPSAITAAPGGSSNHAAVVSVDASGHRQGARSPARRRMSGAPFQPIGRDWDDAVALEDASTTLHGAPASAFGDPIAPIPAPPPITIPAIVAGPIVPVPIVSAPIVVVPIVAESGVPQVGAPVGVPSTVDPPRVEIDPAKREGVRR